MVKNISLRTILIFVLPTIFLSFQIYFRIFSVNNFNWLAFESLDLIYLVERLLLIAQFPKVEQLNSIEIEYGMELFWLAYIVKGYQFFGGENPLFAYHLISIVHLIFVTMNFGLIFKIGQKLELDHVILFWVFACLCLSPMYLFYSGFIKPDTNIVLFAILGILYLSLKNPFTQKTFLKLLFLISFGFAVKWWTIFFILPLIIEFLLGALPKIHFSSRFLRLTLDIAIFSFILYLGYAFSNVLQYIIDNSPQFSFISQTTLVAATLVLSIVPFLSTFTLSRYAKLTEVDKIIKIIIAAYIMASLPFIFSENYLKSVTYFVIHPFEVKGLLDPMVRIMNSLTFWFKNFWEMRIFSPLFFVAVFILFKEKKWLFTHKNHRFFRMGISYICVFVFFIFFLLPRNNHTMMAMLSTVMIVMSAAILQRRQKLLLSLLIFQIPWINTDVQNLTFKYVISQRKNLNQAANELSQQLASHIDISEQTIYQCRRRFPLPTSSRYVFTGREYCETYLKEKIPSEQIWIFEDFLYETLPTSFKTQFSKIADLESSVTESQSRFLLMKSHSL